MNRLKQFIENFLPFIFVFIAGLYRPYDADLGWHLKYGEYFFKFHDVVRDNLFSQMMPNYKWSDTDWLTDVITFFIYHHLGFLGLTLLGALVITVTFYFFSKAFNLDYFEKALIFPFIAYIETPINSVSFRGQLISVMFLGILFYIIEKFDNGNRKIIYFTIPLFLIWANFNGQYLLGLGLFAVWIFMFFVNQFLNKERDINFIKSRVKILSSVFLLSALIILINPFGIDLYRLTVSYIGSGYLKNIAEYVPFKESSSLWWNQLIIGILIGVGFLIIFFNGELKKRVPMFSILGILYILSWIVRRYAWSFYYLAIPFLKPLVFFFKPESKKNAFIAGTFLFTIYIVLALIIKSPLTQFSNMTWNVYCKDLTGCSPKAADFIIKNRLNNNKLFTVYDWGGWLIWNYPQIKPTIDGRMHLWIDEKGYSAFGDYYEYEQGFKSIENSPYDSVVITKGKPLFNNLLELRKEKKWILVYEDENAGIFRRVHPVK